jgi:hypothetical protein
MTTGKLKVGYGASEQEAFENLRLRLTHKELALVVREEPKKVNQREFRNYIGQLG